MKKYTVEQEAAMSGLLDIITQYLEKETKKLFSSFEEQQEFICITAVNIIGNIIMRWSENSVEAKKELAHAVCQNLIEWCEFAIYKLLLFFIKKIATDFDEVSTIQEHAKALINLLEAKEIP